MGFGFSQEVGCLSSASSGASRVREASLVSVGGSSSSRRLSPAVVEPLVPGSARKRPGEEAVEGAVQSVRLRTWRQGSMNEDTNEDTEGAGGPGAPVRDPPDVVAKLGVGLPLQQVMSPSDLQSLFEPLAARLRELKNRVQIRWP